MTRHRGSVRVLAEQKDIRGVDEIIKGLESLKQDRSLDMWSHRMGIYLNAADQFHDPRLIEPLLDILATSEKPEKNHHADVIKILSAYDDSRLIPLFTQYLGTLNPGDNNPGTDHLYASALAALTRRLGENTPKYLIQQLNESENDIIRAAILYALGELSYPDFPSSPRENRWSAQHIEKRDRQKIAARVREQAYPVLVESLNDPSVDVNRMAALGLTIYATGSQRSSIAPDLRAVTPLTNWCNSQNLCFRELSEYLGLYGNADTGKVLLAVLKSQLPTKGDYNIVAALGKLKPEGAVPVLVRNINARCRRPYNQWYYQVHTSMYW